jgi:predicted RNase H-like HicB family nuclease
MSNCLRSGSSNLMRRANRPFDPVTWAESKKIVGAYRIIIQEHPRLGFVGSSIELPNIFVDGRTPQECYKTVQKALSLYVATMLEDNEHPPEGLRKRTCQINIRFTSWEKRMLAKRSKELGFHGLSDFIRTVTIRQINASNEVPE